MNNVVLPTVNNVVLHPVNNVVLPTIAVSCWLQLVNKVFIIIIIIIKTLLSVSMYLDILQTNWGHLYTQLSINQIITYCTTCGII